MADSPIRDVSDETPAERAAADALAGSSQVRYVRRTLAGGADRSGKSPVTRDDWTRLHELTADLADDDLMGGAWS
jgi:hypothetical protein